MIILTLRTDKPEAEIGLYDGDHQIAYVQWEAHRQLAETLHLKIKSLIESHEKQWQDIQGIVIYQGPGSFTGLRIGMSVANALASSLPAAIVATTNDNWLTTGLARLLAGENSEVALPEYGQPAHITQPRK